MVREEMAMTILTQALRSTTYELADALEVNEFYQQRGWTASLWVAGLALETSSAWNRWGSGP
jgi:hypothetical protein